MMHGTGIVARRGASTPRQGPAASLVLLVGLGTIGLSAEAQPLPADATPPAQPSAVVESAQPSAPTESTRPPEGAEAAQPPVAVEAAQPEGSPPPSRITAVWKERRLAFNYGSASTVYECNAMEDRVASVMRAVGARDDVKVRVTGCSHAPSSDPRMNPSVGSRTTATMSPAYERYRSPQGSPVSARQLATVYITAMLPTEVSDDVYAELEKDKSRRELVARVTGNAAARFNDPILFAAQWQRVKLSRDTIGIEAEECELLDQITSTLLPQMDVRVVNRSGTLCSAGSSLPPQIVVEALMPFYGDPSSALPSRAPPPGKTEPKGDEPPSGR
jgi:Predicted membrane protein